MSLPQANPCEFLAALQLQSSPFPKTQGKRLDNRQLRATFRFHPDTEKAPSCAAEMPGASRRSLDDLLENPTASARAQARESRSRGPMPRQLMPDGDTDRRVGERSSACIGGDAQTCRSIYVLR